MFQIPAHGHSSHNNLVGVFEVLGLSPLVTENMDIELSVLTVFWGDSPTCAQ